MLVDDAVVVVEAIYCHRLTRGEEARSAVIEGVKEVAFPVLSSVLTTIAAFLPLMLLPGILGKFMFVVPRGHRGAGGQPRRGLLDPAHLTCWRSGLGGDPQGPGATDARALHPLGTGQILAPAAAGHALAEAGSGVSAAGGARRRRRGGRRAGAGCSSSPSTCSGSS